MITCRTIVSDSMGLLFDFEMVVVFCPENPAASFRRTVPVTLNLHVVHLQRPDADGSLQNS